MEFSQVVANRHSVRDFTDQSVSQEELVDIVRTAQQAPSWVNSQPWRVYAATGHAGRDQEAPCRRRRRR